jgi:ABC-type oligopeptide transport system ATPase subunit
MLTVKGVSKVFDTLDNGVESVRALDDVSLDVKRNFFHLSVIRGGNLL